MKNYWINNELKQNDYDTFHDSEGKPIKPICDRILTNDEVKYGEPNAAMTDFAVDQAKKSQAESKKLDNLYVDKLAMIKQRRDDLILSAKFTSQSIPDFEVDCRLNDVSIVRSLLDGMTATSTNSIIYVGTTSEKQMTIAQFQILYIEMINFGLSIFEHKHKKDKDIKSIYTDATKTVLEKIALMEAITW